MKAHIDKTRSRLGELGGLAARTEAAERRILSSAEARLDAVQGDLDKLSAGMVTASDADENRYLELIEERARLHKVIARSRQALG